ncbi:hypothetical protein C8R46DRAFT_1361170 [Mycena filopes]|nr:hypothetical protein C8R46DRAFT_1361969 [Mycena filopes]KAJ7141570.1 hypothetical protein C8R46DRAFT_1361170 [Mycena filopes]
MSLSGIRVLSHSPSILACICSATLIGVWIAQKLALAPKYTSRTLVHKPTTLEKWSHLCTPTIPVRKGLWRLPGPAMLEKWSHLCTPTIPVLSTSSGYADVCEVEITTPSEQRGRQYPQEALDLSSCTPR